MSGQQVRGGGFEQLCCQAGVTLPGAARAASRWGHARHTLVPRSEEILFRHLPRPPCKRVSFRFFSETVLSGDDFFSFLFRRVSKYIKAGKQKGE